MSVILFLMDAMRSDYITKETTPFLWGCANKGEYYKRIIPHFGFCERTEIFTGQTPKESGFFTALGLDKDDSPFKDIIELPLLEILDRSIPKEIGIPFFLKKGEIYHFFRRIVNRWLLIRTGGISPQNIPIGLLPFWGLTEDKIDHREDHAFNIPSIFKLLNEAGKEFYYDSFSALNIPFNGTDENRLNMMLNNKKKNEIDFSLVYISTPDFYGHEYGPDSNETKNALKNMDSQLKFYTNEVLKIDSNTSFIFLGDHGMAKVEKYFNAEEIILDVAKKHSLKLKKDFIYFLDSTVVRFWFFSDKAKSIFESNLFQSQQFLSNGIFIDEETAMKENIPLGDNRYGDIIWWANTGVLVFPDFFHRVKKYKGMHGYDPSKYENQGTCIVNGEDIEKREIESIYLTDVFDIFKKLLINE